MVFPFRRYFKMAKRWLPMLLQFKLESMQQQQLQKL